MNLYFIPVWQINQKRNHRWSEKVVLIICSFFIVDTELLPLFDDVSCRLTLRD